VASCDHVRLTNVLSLVAAPKNSNGMCNLYLIGVIRRVERGVSVDYTKHRRGTVDVEL
jgi:hypothetical protein